MTATGALASGRGGICSPAPCRGSAARPRHLPGSAEGSPGPRSPVGPRIVTRGWPRAWPAEPLPCPAFADRRVGQALSAQQRKPAPGSSARPRGVIPNPRPAPLSAHPRASAPSPAFWLSAAPHTPAAPGQLLTRGRETLAARPASPRPPRSPRRPLEPRRARRNLPRNPALTLDS